MSESVSSAAPQPTSVPSGVTTANNEVGENMTGSSVKAMLLQRDLARHAEAAPANAPEVATTPEATAEPEPATTSAEDATQNAPETDAPEAAEGEQPEAAEEPSEDVLSYLSKLDPATRQIAEKAIEADRRRNQEAVNKRIGKIKYKQAQAEQAAREAQIREQTLAAQIRQPQAQPPPPVVIDPSQPLADVQTHEALAQRAKEARELVRYVNDVLDTEGIENGVEINGKVWTKAELKTARRNAQTTIEEHVPARQVYLETRQKSVARGVELSPFLKDASSPGYAKAQAIVSDPQYAWLRMIPNAGEALADMVEGRLAREARAKPAPKPAPVKPRPASDQTVTTTTGGGSERAASSVRASNGVQAELARLNEKGNVSGDELRDFLKRKDKFR